MERKSWIVVGTDFTECADQALAHAVAMASQSGANIALVHAYDDLPDGAANDVDIVGELRSRLQSAIARSSAVEDGIHIEPVLRRGMVWEKLQNVATDLGADLIMIGARARRHETEAPIGGLTTRAITAAKRSVLVIALHDTRTQMEES
jgi:nucleotide-binding universal stress UspA family protein